MKIGKFVGKKHIQLDNNDITICIDKLQGTNLNPISYDEINRFYSEKIGNIKIKGIKNYWGTQHRDLQFQAVAKNINWYISKQEGVIENGSQETIISYSISVSTYGDFRYKYQRGWSYNAEIHSHYDYDTNLSELMTRVKEYYSKLKLEL